MNEFIEHMKLKLEHLVRPACPQAMDRRPKFLQLRIEYQPTPPDQSFENLVKDCNGRIDENCSFFGQS
jgi:hypothetical protein